MREQQFLAAVSGFSQGLKPLEHPEKYDRERLLDAEVTLPLVQGVDVALLRVVRVRRPYARESRPLLVDVSRLSGP